MSKHTKGEWFFKRDGWSTVYVECRIGGGVLQEVAACGPTANGSEEQEANASLIAAAPDLLGALELYGLPLSGNDWMDTQEFGSYAVEREKTRRAAISRARGQS